MNESSINKLENHEIQELPFQRIEVRDDVIKYDFKNVEIGIDTTGKNYKDLPEVLFGTKVENGLASTDQPEIKIDDADMNYVVECIKVAMRDARINKFWFYPYYGDAPEEDRTRREMSRIRLFKRYFDNIVPDQNKGYIVMMPD